MRQRCSPSPRPLAGREAAAAGVPGKRALSLPRRSRPLQTQQKGQVVRRLADQGLCAYRVRAGCWPAAERRRHPKARP